MLFVQIVSSWGDDVVVGSYYCKVVDVVFSCGDVLNNYGVWLCIYGQFVVVLEWFD